MKTQGREGGRKEGRKANNGCISLCCKIYPCCLACWEIFFLNKYTICLFLYIYKFIYLFLAVLGLRFCARAFSSCSEWGPLFITVHGPLTIAASHVAEHRFQMRRLSSCGSWAQLLRGMWDLPRPGLKPLSPALAGRFSTTAPPGKPLLGDFWLMIQFPYLLLTYSDFFLHDLVLLSCLFQRISSTLSSLLAFNCSL